jgi:ribosomal protein S21
MNENKTNFKGYTHIRLGNASDKLKWMLKRNNNDIDKVIKSLKIQMSKLFVFKNKDKIYKFYEEVMRQAITYKNKRNKQKNILKYGTIYTRLN